MSPPRGFRIKELGPEQLATYAALDQLKQIQSIETNPKDSNSFVMEQTLPVLTNGRGGKLVLRLQQGHMATTIGTGEQRTVFNLSFLSCWRKSCENIESKARAKADSLANWKFLPEGTTISAVLYGDINGDRRNDVLIRFSNGGGILYESLSRPSPRAWIPADHDEETDL